MSKFTHTQNDEHSMIKQTEAINLISCGFLFNFIFIFILLEVYIDKNEKYIASYNGKNIFKGQPRSLAPGAIMPF